VAEKGPIPFDDFLPLAAEVAAALQAAHRAELLHRDVKPANLLVRREGQRWQVRVIDFGLALRQDMLSQSGSSYIQRGHSTVGSAIAGTLDYAAPEQMGKLPGVPVGPAADIYGFAKTACYALFQSPEPTFLDWKKLPLPAAELLGKCLSRQPEQRPASFAMILRLLEQLHVPEVVPFVKPVLRGPATKAPPPLPPVAKPVAVPVVHPVARPVAPATQAAVRFFMPAQSGLASMVSQPLYKVYVNRKHAGEGLARAGFQLRFELPPGVHCIEVVCWQNGERGRKDFVLDMSRPGDYEVRFNPALPELAASLFGGASGDLMQKCTVDVLKAP
jgi:hypothetical protein